MLKFHVQKENYKIVYYTISCSSTYKQGGTAFPDQFWPHSPPSLLPLPTHANNALVALPKSHNIHNFGADISTLLSSQAHASGVELLQKFSPIHIPRWFIQELHPPPFLPSGSTHV